MQAAEVPKDRATRIGQGEEDACIGHLLVIIYLCSGVWRCERCGGRLPPASAGCTRPSCRMQGAAVLAQSRAASPRQGGGATPTRPAAAHANVRIFSVLPI